MKTIIPILAQSGATETAGFTISLGVLLLGFIITVAFLALPFYVARMNYKMSLIQRDLHELLRYKRVEMGVTTKTAAEVRAESKG